MESNDAKNIYAIDILGKKSIVKYDGKNILLFGIGNIDSNGLEYMIFEYIKHELMYYNDSIENLRPFLAELQKVISKSNRLDMLSDVREYFFQTTNIFTNDQEDEKTSSKIEKLKEYKENILDYTNKDIYAQEDGLETSEKNNNAPRKGGKQKVLSNGKSLLDKEAFVNSFVLALLVSISGLVIFSMLLFKII